VPEEISRTACGFVEHPANIDQGALACGVLGVDQASCKSWILLTESALGSPSMTPIGGDRKLVGIGET